MQRLSFIIALAFAIAPLSAQAATTDPLIEGAKLCTVHLPRYEREYGIPTHLLSAIASTESGRYHDGLKIKVPWPWTINAEGKGYIYNTKQEAIEAVRKLRARGIESIDVGCMQVNLYHHPDAFASLEQAFEPQNNVAYAASFLRSLYEEEGSWKKAAGDYHSKTPALGNQYVGLVYNSWYQIIEKLREARLQVPASSVMAMNDLKSGNSITRIAPASHIISISPQGAVKDKRLAYSSPRMNSISVKKQATRENGIIVVRPETDSNAPTMTVAQARPVTADMPELVTPKIIHVSSPQPTANSDALKNGPRFIFSD